MADGVHQARLEQVLEELVVDDAATGLDPDDEARLLLVGVSLEGIVERPAPAEEDRDGNLLVRGLVRLHAEPELGKVGATLARN